jgi:peroxiredoxin
VTRTAQSLSFIGVALLAALAGYLLNPFAGGTKVDTDALLAASLPDLDGQRRHVGDWRGNVLVVNFWATWCPPCLEEIPEFVRMQARFAPNGVQFIGIAVDQPAKVRDFALRHRINYPVLVGHAGAIELSRLAGNARGGLPYTLVLDREGQLIQTFIGRVSEDKLEAALAAVLEP